MPLGGRQQRCVLAVLLTNANQTVSTDRLVDDVWGDDPPETARRSLQAYISRLRGLLGNEAITAVDPGYVLHVDPGDADWERITAQARRGREELPDDPVAAAGCLREALAMWRGAPFADPADEPSLRSAIARLENQRAANVEDRIAADLAGLLALQAGELRAGGLPDDHSRRGRRPHVPVPAHGGADRGSRSRRRRVRRRSSR